MKTGSLINKYHCLNFEKNNLLSIKIDLGSENQNDKHKSTLFLPLSQPQLHFFTQAAHGDEEREIVIYE